MRGCYWLRVLLILLTGAVLGGCAGRTGDAVSNHTVRSFSDRTRMYRVEIDQAERSGACIRRTVLFTSHSRLYVRPYVDRVRAVDAGCDASFTSGFETFTILRDVRQQTRYERDFDFRRRVNEDLWDAYVHTLFNDTVDRQRSAADDNGDDGG